MWISIEIFFRPRTLILSVKVCFLRVLLAFFLTQIVCFVRGQISLAELSASLKSLNTAKAPGSDGLTVEFFSKFWNLLGPLLLEVINKCFADGELTDSTKSSVTRLIFKKRGDIRDLKNWRPNFLLNADYKICSKSITLHLSKVLDSIVNPDQTCSVPGRSISSNLVMLRD